MKGIEIKKEMWIVLFCVSWNSRRDGDMPLSHYIYFVEPLSLSTWVAKHLLQLNLQMEYIIIALISHEIP